MSYLEKRRNLYYAVLTIPEDVREKLGKLRFVQSLGTPIKSVAEREAAPLVGKWKAMIAEARGNTDALIEEALRWQRHLTLQQQPSKSNDQMRVTGLDVLRDQIYDRTIELSRTKGDDVAQKFRSIAEGTARLSNEHLAAWKAQLTLAPKSKDQAIKDVELLVTKFTTIDEITKGNVKKWMDEIVKAGKGIASQKRILSFSRNYWRYLQSSDVVSVDFDPFNGVLNIGKGKKADGKQGGSNLPYSAAEVVKLWETAKKRKVGSTKDAPFDTQLANLILLGAYTGARIEELCSLKTIDVTEQSFRITDAKTEAGIREVPIHSAIASFVKKLTKESEDGYLLSGLTFNKYQDRSNAIGKRYGRLKTSLGYSGSYTFHSLRSTVITQFENAGVSENLAADIVGHEKPRITYGLYSGGASLPVKKEAIELVKYPFPK